MADLSQLRQEIDGIDNQILRLFEKRMQIAKQVAQHKAKHRLPIFQGDREQQVIDRISAKAAPENRAAARMLFTEMMDASKALQSMLYPPEAPISDQIKECLSAPANANAHPRIGCQGVAGAYSHVAGKALFPDATLSFFPSFDEVFRAVGQGDIAYGILPLENSSAGSVVDVYGLMREYDFYIHSAVKIKIEHCLAARPGVTLAQINRVYSHKHALPQCSHFLRKSGLRAYDYPNTAMAAKLVAESDEPIAAICSRECAALYHLDILQDNIQNSDENYTRFICISPALSLDSRANTVSVYLTLPHTVGSLYRLLSRFAIYGLNLLKIESVQLGTKDFDACFYLDFAGNVSDKRVMTLLRSLQDEMHDFRFLGNYIEHTPSYPDFHEGAPDADARA